jgi:hypothetical protein
MQMQPMTTYGKQVDAFLRKFGREMPPEGPFFDPNADTAPDDLQVALLQIALH